jgi:hypothetical protein
MSHEIIVSKLTLLTFIITGKLIFSDKKIHFPIFNFNSLLNI